MEKMIQGKNDINYESDNSENEYNLNGWNYDSNEDNNDDDNINAPDQ